MDNINTIYTQLAKFGLSEKEIAVYVATLKLGSSTLQDIAYECKLKRSTTYNYVESLIDKGFLTQTKKGSKRLVVAEDPEKIEKILETKQWEMSLLKKSLPSTISILKSFLPDQDAPRTGIETDIKFYEGVKAIKQIYDDTLNAKEMWSYLNIEAVFKVFPENKEKYDNAMNKGMKLREIIDYGSASNNKKGFKEYVANLEKNSSNQNYDYRLVPMATDISTVDYMIYDGKIGVVSIDEKQPIGFIIKNRHLYEHSKAIFEIAWGSLKKTL